MEEWKECKLGDVVEIHRGASPSPIQNFIATSGMPWVKISDATASNSRFIDSTKEFIIEEGISKSVIVNPEDLIVSNSATPGLPKIMKIKACIHDGWLYFENYKNITRDFLYYKFFDIQRHLTNLANGSVFQNLKTDIVRDFTIKLPPLPTQQKIAAILSSLDDKIELNNKINTNLEQQVQALFKNWFLDFEPFGGKMPEGWKVGKLSDVAEIKTDTFKPEQNPDIQVEHYSLPAFDEKRYPSFEVSNELKSNKFIISKDVVLVSKLNPTVKRVWRPYCLTDKSISSTEFIVYKPTSIELRDYLFSIVNSSEFNDFMCSNVTGSTNSHQRTPPKTTLNYEIPIPTKEILHKFCNIVTPMYDKIKENIKQNETVSSLRDTLLPKLMNGEIEV